MLISPAKIRDIRKELDAAARARSGLPPERGAKRPFRFGYTYTEPTRGGVVGDYSVVDGIPVTPEELRRAQQRVLAGYRSSYLGWIRWAKEWLGLREYDPENYPGRVFTPDQEEVIHCVYENPRTLVQSCYGAGKTFLGAVLILIVLDLYESEVLTTSSSGFQVRERIWAEVRRLYNGAPQPLGPRDALNASSLTYDDKWKAHAVSTNNPSNIQGGHAPTTLVVIDEGQGVDKEIWTAAESMMTGTNARMVVFFNPLFTSGPAYAASRRPDEWKRVKLSAERHPNVVTQKELIPGAVTYKWIKDKERSWGRSSPLFIARALGEFPPEGSDVLISIGDFEGVAELDVAGLVRDGRHLGVDISSSGIDMCEAVLVEDRNVSYREEWHDPDLMRSAGRIIQIVNEFDIPWSNVHIDNNGVGAGVVARLREQGYNAEGVMVGGGPIGDWPAITEGFTFLNRRSELYWVMRELVKRRMIKIDREHEQIVADLSDVKFSTRSDGKIQIESKDEIKARLKRSPDAGDAAIMALSRASLVTPGIEVF